MATATTTRPPPPKAGRNGTLNEVDLEFGADQRVATSGWGNAGPLSLLAFAVVTLMISLVNVKAISADVAPAVVAVGLIFGGTTQLIGGLIQLRNGNTFQGVLFSSFGAFWISLAAILEWFLKTVPAHHQGQALGLLLYGFTPLVLVLWLASFRTSAVVVVALGTVLVTFVLLAVGQLRGLTRHHPHRRRHRDRGGSARLLSGVGGALRVLLRPGGAPRLVSSQELTQP